MVFYSEERIGLFIDGSNLYAAARALGFDIDYKRLLELFADKGHLIRAFYYTALMEDQEYSPIRPLVDWLDYNGYTMVTKPTKEFTDATGRRKIKGNMDIELAIDVMEMAEHLDHIVQVPHAAHHHHRDANVAPVEGPHQGVTVDPRHLQVEHQQVGGLAVQDRHRFPGTTGDKHLESEPLKGPFE